MFLVRTGRFCTEKVLEIEIIILQRFLGLERTKKYSRKKIEIERKKIEIERKKCSKHRKYSVKNKRKLREKKSINLFNSFVSLYYTWTKIL